MYKLLYKLQSSTTPWLVVLVVIVKSTVLITEKILMFNKNWLKNYRQNSHQAFSKTLPDK